MTNNSEGNMPQQQINYTQEDRDRSIRTEAEVKHVDAALGILKSETKDLVELSRNQSFTIAGILESMKDAKTFMHEVGQHSSKIALLENELNEMQSINKDLLLDSRAQDTRIKEIETKLDRATFLWKIIAAIIGSPVMVYALIQSLVFIQHVPK